MKHSNKITSKRRSTIIDLREGIIKEREQFKCLQFKTKDYNITEKKGRSYKDIKIGILARKKTLILDSPLRMSMTPNAIAKSSSLVTRHISESIVSNMTPLRKFIFIIYDC